MNANSNTERGGADVKQVPGTQDRHRHDARRHHSLSSSTRASSRNNLFDLDKRTIRFTPRSAGGFRAENLPLQWDAATGTRAAVGNDVRLTKFAVPVFRQDLGRDAVHGHRPHHALAADTTTSVSAASSTCSTAGPAIVNKIPVIAAFLKQRMNGTRFVNELDDRLILTWDTSEPTSGQQDVTFTRTPHHYQAVLHRDGRIDLSYREITARDAVVGVYTVPPGGAPADAVRPTSHP